MINVISSVVHPEDYNKTPESFGEALNAFAQYVADNFATSKNNHQRS